eukprot:g2436.t1
MEEEDFPRGPDPKPLKIHPSPFDQPHIKRRKKFHQPEIQEEVHLSQTKAINKDRFQIRAPGSKVLGMVVEVTSTQLLLSLPHGEEATVEINEASDVINEVLNADSSQSQMLKKLIGDTHDLTEIFIPGQYVHGTFVPDQDNDGVKLSLKLSHFYERVMLSKLAEGSFVCGCIRTIEDHGFAVTFGQKGVSGFLHKTDVDPYINENRTLLPGQLVEVTIKSFNSNGVLQLSLNQEAVKSSMVIEGSTVHPQTVLPGDLIHSRVTKVVENGIFCKVMNRYKGVVSIHHCGRSKGDYVKGQVVKARVLGWNAIEQNYILSFLDFLVNWSLPKMPAIIGQVFKAARIHRIDESSGLEVVLPTQSATTKAYVHLSSLSDLSSVTPRDYKLNQEVSVRVTGFQALDGLITGSLKESVLRSGIVCFDDISPGLIGEGSVTKVHPERVILSIAEGITGFSRPASSLPLNQVYHEGQIVKYRVLKLKPVLKQVIVSLESKLVNAKVPFLTNYEDAVLGMQFIGYILAVKPHLVIVAFAGDLCGILPKSNANLSPQDSLTDCFIKNKAVKVWIQSMNPTNQKLVLTLVKPSSFMPNQRLLEKNSTFQEKCKCPEGVNVGDIAQSVFIKRLKHDTGFLLKLEFTDQDLSAYGVLPIGHLCDHPMVQTDLQKGQQLGAVIVLRNQDYLEVSRKPSLIKSASVLPRSLDEVKENMLLPGFVSLIGNGFVDVTFLAGVTGRVFENQLPLNGVPPSSQFHTGQSVQVRVLKVDIQRKRFNLTMNASRLMPMDSVFLRDGLEDLLQKSEIQIGSIVTAKIVEVTEKEAKCEIDGKSELIGYIPRSQVMDEVTDVTACVVDVTASGKMTLYLKPYLLKKGYQTVRRKKSSKLKKEKYEAVVEFICEFYLVVSIPEEDHTLAMVSLLDYNLQFDNLFKSFKEGQRIEVERLSEVKKTSTISCPIMSIPLLPFVWKTHPKTATPLKKLSFNKENVFFTKTDIEISNSGRSVQIGDLVSGKIIRFKETGVEASLTVDPSGSRALIPFIHLFDHFTDHLCTLVYPNQAFRGLVTKQSLKGPCLSLRASAGGALEGLKETPNGNPCPVRITRDSIQRGDQLEGYIGCDLIATVHHPHFGDEAIENLSDQFQIGQRIKGTIVSLNYPKIGISLRSGKKPLAEIDQVKKGVITSVLPHGVYVRLEDSGIQGLVPKMEIQSHQKGMLKVGNIVSVKVDASTDGFFLNLRFHEQQPIASEAELVEISDHDEEMEEAVDFEQRLAAAVAAEHHHDFTEIPQSPYNENTNFTEPNPGIWADLEAEINPQEIQSTQQIEPKESEVTKSRCFETEPQSMEDFERLLMSNSSSSYLWIRYMVFYLEKGDIFKARATAERALAAMPFRDEEAKMEIWLAYLNLERTVGTPVESIMTLFHKAVLSNDAKKLHLNFLRVLEESKETEVGDLVTKSLHRRCPTSAKAYIQELHYWLSTNRGVKCKETLERALKLLPKRKHVKVLTQAALLEFKLGLVERARDIFEGLLACYPKRMDLWNVYLDQELILKDREHARALLERAASLDLGKKRMKGIFKRYLQFESQYGTHTTVENVKAKARDYINRKNSQIETE